MKHSLTSFTQNVLTGHHIMLQEEVTFKRHLLEKVYVLNFIHSLGSFTVNNKPSGEKDDNEPASK